MDRDEFIDLLTDELSEDPDNNRLNRILEAADEYAENEKEQLSCEGTTSDIISRQQAIDRFNVIRPVDPKKDEYTKGIDVGIAMCIVAVKDQPTIQPQSTTGQLNNGAQSTNLIDRQQALDAVNAMRFGMEKMAFEIITTKLLELPPAQPERQRGEWIEISSINHTYKCSECGRLLVNVTDGKNNVSKHYPYCHCGGGHER